MKLRAFTLAEVLITLGIIGIVAAMTLPVLIQKHRRSAAETALRKIYTNMNQAILRSVVDNDEVRDWTFGANSIESHATFFNCYLKNYLKTLKTEVFPVQTKTAGTSDLFTIFFADGSGIAMQYGGHDWLYCIKARDLQNFYDKRGTGCFKFGIYPTGAGNSESYSSQNFNNKFFEPYVNQVAYDEDGEYITDDAGNRVLTDETTLYQQKCYAKVIQLNGWKIPKDYPLKF